MASNVTFRRANAEDALAFFGRSPPFSFRGWVAEQDGQVTAIGGLYYEDGRPVAFSDMGATFRKSRKDIAKGCRILMQMIDKIKGPVYAVANPNEPTANYLLAKLGWKPTGRFTDVGELMVRG